MRRRRVLAGALFTIVALSAFAGGAAVVAARKKAPNTPLSAAQTLLVNCASPSLGGKLPAAVYLPPGYKNSSRRYPVIYFLHGLPAGPMSYQNNGFIAAALARSGRRAIVVAPQGARDSDSDREYLDWDASEDWPAAISRDLPLCIDKRYRTIASRSGRALIGLSAGGYGAFNIGLRTLSQFGAVESWSGYFAATDPSGYHILNLGSPRANTAAQVPSGAALKNELAAWPSLIAFYVGNQDSRFLNMNRQFDAALREGGIKHKFAIYEGGHTVTLWASHAPAWLGMALDALAAEANHH